MPANVGSEGGKVLKFAFRVDEQSAQRVLDIFKAITEAARQAQQASGGVFGGLMGSMGAAPGGGAFPGMPAAPGGGATPAKGSLAQVVLENVNAFRKIQGVGEQALRGLTDVLRRAVGEQRRELESLDRTLAGLARKYEDLNQKAAGSRSATMAQRYDVQAQGVQGEMAEVQLQRSKVQADLKRMTTDAGAGGGDTGEAGGGRGGLGNLGRMFGRMGLAGAILSGAEGILGQPLAVERAEARNAAARAGLAGDLYRGITGGDFSTMAILARRNNLVNIAYGAGVGSTPGKIGLGLEMGSPVKDALGMLTGGMLGGGAQSFGKDMANVMTGGFGAAQAREIQGRIEAAKAADPLFMATLEDAERGAARRFQFRNAMGSETARNRAFMVGLMRKGARGGLGESETQALGLQLRGLAGGDIAEDVLGAAASSESQFGVGRGTAAQFLGTQAMAGGGAERAKQFWSEVMGKAFSVGIRDSRMREVLVEAVSTQALTARGRLGGTAGADLLLAGQRPGADLFDLQQRMGGLGLLNQYMTAPPGSAQSNLKFAGVFSALSRQGIRGPHAGIIATALSTLAPDEATALMQWRPGAPIPGGQAGNVINMLTGEQQTLKDKTLTLTQDMAVQVAQTVGRSQFGRIAGAPAIFAPDIQKVMDQISRGETRFEDLSPHMQDLAAAYNARLSGGTIAQEREAMIARGAMARGERAEFVGPLPPQVGPGDVDKTLALGAAQLGLDPLIRSLKTDFPGAVQEAVAASHAFIERLRNDGRALMELDDPGRVLRDAAGALREVARAAKQVVDVAAPLGYTGAATTPFGKQGD